MLLVIVITIVGTKQYLTSMIISSFFSKLEQVFPQASFTLDGGTNARNANDFNVFDFGARVLMNFILIARARALDSFSPRHAIDRSLLRVRHSITGSRSREIIRRFRCWRSATSFDSSTSAMMKYRIIGVFSSPRSSMNFLLRRRNPRDESK